jgi:enamine deaminase RidA (YjgF/YER057c/UK114 family)
MSKNREQVSTGSPWEDIVGYSRAVKVGHIIEVTGTVADDHGQLMGGNDPYLQTRYAIEKIKDALASLGASLEDVVRTRMFVTNIDDWEAYGKAHADYFADIKPATTMVEVSRLMHDQYLVEIEATAILKE